MNWKPIFRYRLRENLIGGFSFFAVLTLIMVIFSGVSIFITNQSDLVSVNVYTVSAATIFLVLGITSIREDLRLGIQCGLSRKTVVVGNFLAALILAVLLSVAGELLVGAVQQMVSSRSDMVFADLYQSLFLETTTRTLTLAQHGESFLFNLFIQLVCYAGGMFFSLSYYRLSKFWCAVVGVGQGALTLVGIPVLSWKYATVLLDFAQWTVSSLWNFLILMFVGFLVAMAANILLLRRAPIKGLKSA